MAETLYGPWRIVMTHVNSHLHQQMVITGSDDADGEYEIRHGGQLDVTVQGAQWKLQTQFYPFGGPNWRNGGMRAVSRFDLQKGLLIEIGCAARAPGTGTEFGNAKLLCTSLDEATNPPSSGTPPDFTLPDG